uniref:Uncharacterized protein n=1 Tax=Arundo donax TaxID=35708 RepID=A0A0A8YJ15_ARUDO
MTPWRLLLERSSPTTLPSSQETPVQEQQEVSLEPHPTSSAPFQSKPLEKVRRASRSAGSQVWIRDWPPAPWTCSSTDAAK